MGHIKIKMVKSKVYFILKTKDEIRETAIEYNQVNRSKKWNGDTEGFVNDKYERYIDRDSSLANKLLVKTYFNDDEQDFDKLINDIKLGNCKYSSSINYSLNKRYGSWLNVDNDTLKSHFEIVIPQKPKTYPKYSNEKPFKCFTYNSPEIISIYWDGFNWQYQMKNVGHIYDFYSEDEINKYNQ